MQNINVNNISDTEKKEPWDIEILQYQPFSIDYDTRNFIAMLGNSQYLGVKTKHNTVKRSFYVEPPSEIDRFRKKCIKQLVHAQKNNDDYLYLDGAYDSLKNMLIRKNLYNCWVAGKYGSKHMKGIGYQGDSQLMSQLEEEAFSNNDVVKHYDITFLLFDCDCGCFFLIKGKSKIEV